MIHYFAGSRSSALIKNHLIVWTDKGAVAKREEVYTKDSNILVDSGAFSAYTQGKTVDIDEYIEWIKNYKLKWGKKVNQLNFINLDVIGSPQDSQKNLNYLIKNNVNVLPVLHQAGFNVDTLKSYLAKHDYIAFGGMVGRKRKQDTIPWLNKCFHQIGKHYKKTKKLPRIHLLGVGSEDMMYRYPACSVDNTNWLAVYRFGRSNFIHELKAPRESQDRDLVEKIVEYDIKRFQEIELNVTNYWTKKGVSFNE